MLVIIMISNSYNVNQDYYKFSKTKYLQINEVRYIASESWDRMQNKATEYIFLKTTTTKAYTGRYPDFLQHYHTPFTKLLCELVFSWRLLHQPVCHWFDHTGYDWLYSRIYGRCAAHNRISLHFNGISSHCYFASIRVLLPWLLFRFFPWYQIIRLRIAISFLIQNKSKISINILIPVDIKACLCNTNFLQLCNSNKPSTITLYLLAIKR